MKTVTDIQATIVWVGAILLALIIGGYILIRVVRARIRATQATETFTLNDLRALRASGQLSDAEYERMRAMLIGTRPKIDGARQSPPRSGDES